MPGVSALAKLCWLLFVLLAISSFVRCPRVFSHLVSLRPACCMSNEQRKYWAPAIYRLLISSFQRIFRRANLRNYCLHVFADHSIVLHHLVSCPGAFRVAICALLVDAHLGQPTFCFTFVYPCLLRTETLHSHTCTIVAFASWSAKTQAGAWLSSFTFPRGQ